MQADETELWRLAGEMGIEPRYWDIAGNLHETAAETARTVLEALGVPAGSHEDVAASLAMLAEEQWRDPLPPAVIAREHEKIIVPLRLPLNGGAKTMPWSVQLESGETRSGDCDLAALPVDETGECRGAPMGLRRLVLEPLAAGYHELRLANRETSLLIVAPARCFLPASGRYWGIATQLYALRSAINWGIGDFGDLRRLVEQSSAHGATMIGLNPLHALFLDAPDQASPYSPCSRLFRNPLYLDVTAVPEFETCEQVRTLLETSEMRGALEAARSGTLIDYKAVAKCKLAVLEALHRSFGATHGMQESPRGRAFREFVVRSGPSLRGFATFQLLSEQFGTHDWSRWPAEFADCKSEAVSALQARHAERISFFSYLQWLCEEQFASVAETARRGMSIGLYNDLAVSVDAPSADHWLHRDAFVAQLRVGAPPDPFNERGQEWGVVPLNPRQLKNLRYSHFIALLRANMRHAGALRIDHVMGLQRLFLIPAGAPAASGAYVRYPLDELLAIVALESQRNHCVVIGEDLGTVPEGFRERMADANVLSCRVFYFERENDQFRSPAEFPPLACVMASTHDLPTLRGFWTGDDIAAKSHLGNFKSADEEAQAVAARVADKRHLLQALVNEGLLPAGLSPSDADHIEWTPDLATAVHCYLARTPSVLFMAQMDDLANALHQANLPGSTTENPNWRRRMSPNAADLLIDPAVAAQLAAVNDARKA